MLAIDVILATGVHTFTTATAFPWTTVVSLTISGVVGAIGLTALLVTLDVRRRAETATLLARFDAKEFHVRMWRMEQITRQGKDATHVYPTPLDDLRLSLANKPDRLAILNEGVATDWSSNRVDMQSVYFFALEMRNTLPVWKRPGRRGARRLNRAFGYQLLSTFLDQQIVAWRLLPNKSLVKDEDQRPTYYADNYGLTDPRYVELVGWLADDLLGKRGKHLPAEALRRLRGKRDAIAEASKSRRV